MTASHVWSTLRRMLPLYLLLPDVAKGIWVLHLTPHDGNPTPWIYWRFPSDSDSKVHSDVNTTSCHSASDKQNPRQQLGKNNTAASTFIITIRPLYPRNGNGCLSALRPLLHLIGEALGPCSLTRRIESRCRGRVELQARLKREGL